MEILNLSDVFAISAIGGFISACIVVLVYVIGSRHGKCGSKPCCQKQACSKPSCQGPCQAKEKEQKEGKLLTEDPKEREKKPASEKETKGEKPKEQ